MYIDHQSNFFKKNKHSSDIGIHSASNYGATTSNQSMRSLHKLHIHTSIYFPAHTLSLTKNIPLLSFFFPNTVYYSFHRAHCDTPPNSTMFIILLCYLHLINNCEFFCPFSVKYIKSCKHNKPYLHWMSITWRPALNWSFNPLCVSSGEFTQDKVFFSNLLPFMPWCCCQGSPITGNC